METIRTKEEIMQMLRYVLDDSDMRDGNLLAHWTDVLFELHEIRQKFPRPTVALLDMRGEVHNTRKMRVEPGGLKIDSNHQEKWLEHNTPDIKIYGDMTLESCQRDLTVIGNVNGPEIIVAGNLNTDTLCNVGSLVIHCDKLNIDTFRVSGSVVIHAKEIVCSDYVADKSTINGNVKTTFFNSNNTKIIGDVDTVCKSDASDEDFAVDLNKP
jgi:hypothetical protein